MKTHNSEDGATPTIAKQKSKARTSLITAYASLVVMAGCLLYLLWEWYRDPHATWGRRALIVIQLIMSIWIADGIIKKDSAD